VIARALMPGLGVLVTLLAATSNAQPGLAQVLPQPVQLPAGAGDLFANPADWMARLISSMLLGAGQRTTTDVVDFMNWLLKGGNVISQTPPGLSYSSDAVIRLWATMRTVANAGLAVVTVWGGVNLIVHPQIRAPYHGVLELAPRLLLSGILVNTSLDWGHFVIDLNNALCQALGSAAIPAWGTVLDPTAGTPLLNLIAMVIYLIMGLLLLGQMLMRLALVDALLVIAPVALLCWVLPQTYGWARLWFSTFFGTVFVQSIQVLVLQLGSQLIQELPRMMPSLATDPADSGRAWLMTLFLAVAVLQVARKVPRLMPGYPGGVTGGGTSLGTIRQMASLVRGLSAGRSGR
jgi:hypothetical protein